MIKLNGKEVLFETFPNGETKLVESSIKDNVEYLLYNKLHFKYENDSDLIKLMFTKKYLDTLKAEVNLLIYYMPYSRMDRSENGSAFTLKYVTEFINDLMFDSITVIEPHSDVTTALLDDVTAINVTTAILPRVMEEIGFHPVFDCIVFPDSGASKRYKFPNIPNQIVGHKVRDFDTGRIVSLDLLGDPDTGYGKRAIIIDDLSSYGGTFIMTANALKGVGFEEVYLIVGHAEDSIFEGKMFDEGSPIDKIFTTDSLITKHNFFTGTKYAPKLKVYPIEELIS